MRLLALSTLAATTLLAGCLNGTNPTASTTATEATDPLYTALAGNSFARGDFVITFNTDGTIRTTNPTVLGTWEVRDGQFCRTITEPAQIAGSECQDVTIDADAYTFSGPSGERIYTLVR